MNEEEKIEYCKKLVIANLKQYVEEKSDIFAHIYALNSDESNGTLLKHLEVLNEVIEETIDILKKKREVSQ